MTELETIQRAKMYIEKLARGIDPLTGQEVPEDDVVNNVRISRCLFFTAETLGKLIDMGGFPQPKVSSADKAPFSITQEQLKGYQFPQWDAPISDITARINSLIDENTMRKLSYTAITTFLIESGFLEVWTDSQGKRTKRPTTSGGALGISMEERDGKYGTYTAVVYNRNAQQFILDNMDGIIDTIERDRQQRSDERRQMNRPWTAKEVGLLDELYRQGVQVPDMATRLNRSPSAVRGMLDKLGLPAESREYR